MAQNSIHIAGFFSKSDISELGYLEKELQQQGISLSVRCLQPAFINGVIDLLDFDIISLSFVVLNQFFINSGYDLTKHFILKLWKYTSKPQNSQTPFTLEISGIPTINGPENLKFKVLGELSDEIKLKIINEAFNTTNKITRNQYLLMEKNVFHSTTKGYVFRYNKETEQFLEVDFLKEIEDKNKNS